jgi:hypothetical protein
MLAFRFVLAFCVSPLVPGSASGTTVRRLDLPELVRGAGLVFSGEVTTVSSRREAYPGGHTIMSDVAFRVNRVLKGATDSSLILSTVGGTIGDETLEIDGFPRFSTGDRVVVFVASDRNRACPIFGLSQGRFRLRQSDTDTGDDTELVDPADAGRVLQTTEGRSANRPRVTRAELEDIIRALAR